MEIAHFYKIARKENFTKKEFSLLVDIEFYKDLVSFSLKQKSKSPIDWCKNALSILRISLHIAKFKCKLYYLRAHKLMK